MVCPEEYNKFIDDNMDDYGRVNALDYAVQQEARAEQLAKRAKSNNQYVIPSKAINADVAAEMVGKTMTLESTDSYTFENVVVESAVVNNVFFYTINDEYTFDIRKGATTNGEYLVTMGSEEELHEVGTVPLKELTGTLAQNLDEMMEIAAAYDAENGTSIEAIKYAKEVLAKYKEIMANTGMSINIDAKLYNDMQKKLNTRGEATPSSGGLKLILSNNRHRSATEVLAHELQHILVSRVLAENPWLKNEVEALRQATRKHLIDLYGEEEAHNVFIHDLVGKGLATSDDTAYAKKLWNYVFEDGNNPVDEFLAFATTNDSLASQMEGIEDAFDVQKINIANGKPMHDENGNPVGEKKAFAVKLINNIKGTGKFARVVNMIIDTINLRFSSWKTSDKNMQELAKDLLNVALEKAFEAEKTAEANRVLDFLDKADRLIADFGLDKKLNNAQDGYAKWLANEKADSVNRAIDKLWEIHGLAKLRNWALQQGLFNSITKNLDNPMFAKFYEKFRQGKAFVEKVVVAQKNVTANTFNTEYGFDKMDKAVRIALKKVLLDTDAKVITDTGELLEYLENDSIRNDEINALLDGLSDKTKAAVKDLARLMVFNKAELENPYVNASQIAMLAEGTVHGGVVNNIDKAATLMAFGMVDKNDLALAIKGIKENSNGVKKVLALQAAKEESIIVNAYNKNRMYQVKGATQQEFNPYVTSMFVDEKEKDNLVAAKYTNLGEHKGLSEVLGKKIYLVVGKNLESAYSEGLMKTVQLKNEGDSVRRLLLDTIDGISEEGIQDAISLIESGSVDNGWRMIPERDGNGRIYDYRVRLPNDVKSAYLGADNDIISTIAVTSSNFLHKEEAMSSNRKNLKYMNELYDSYKNDKRYKFIEISEKSKGKEKEYWDLIPYYLKNEIKKGPNKGRLYVEQSMLVNYFGYKDVNAADFAWIKNKANRRVVAKYIQEMAIEIVKRWKKETVPFSVKTVAGNNTSNMVVALQLMKNKNPLNYLKQYSKFWMLLNEYQADRAEFFKLTTMRAAGEDVDAKKIAGLERKMEQNLVHPLVKDGQYTSMLEDMSSDQFENVGHIEAKIKALLAHEDKDKVRSGVKMLFDTLYITQDSKMHDSIMKMTTYADAINKLIILYDMAENSKEKVITQEMLNYMDSMHVNYSYLDNRWIKFANDLGGLVFTKYLFRVLPAVLRMAQKKAATMAVTEGIQLATGVDIPLPLDQFVYNPISGGFRHVGLNPLDVAIENISPTLIF